MSPFEDGEKERERDCCAEIEQSKRERKVEDVKANGCGGRCRLRRASVLDSRSPGPPGLLIV